MIPSLYSSLFQMPSVQTFIEAMVDDVRQGQNVLALIPNGIDSVLVRSRVKQRLWQIDFRVQDVPLERGDTALAPETRLSNGLGMNLPTSVNLYGIASYLINDSALPPDVIFISGFDRLSVSDQGAWLNMITQWARICQSQRDAGKNLPPLLLMIPAETAVTIPDGNTHLSVHWWWGFPSGLELRLLCRSSDETDRYTRWREHILPSIASSDISLMEFIWDDILSDTDILCTRLISYAGERGWLPDDICAWKIPSVVFSFEVKVETSRQPSREYRDLWSRGALVWTVEYGLELHSSVLAILDERHSIERRLWRGQADLLIPLLDRARYMINTYLTHRYGKNWPLQWDTPSSAEEVEAAKTNPLAVEWGYLEHLFRNCPALKGESRMMPLIAIGRDIRNRIAHYRVVSFADYDHFLNEAQRILKYASGID